MKKILTLLVLWIVLGVSLSACHKKVSDSMSADQAEVAKNTKVKPFANLFRRKKGCPVNEEVDYTKEMSKKKYKKPKELFPKGVR